MASLEQLEAALRNADAAGDEQAARALAAEIVKTRGVKQELPPTLRALSNATAGAIRGAGSIGATLLTPLDLALGNTKSLGNPERRKAMDAALASLGFDPSSLPFQAGKLGGEVAGTLGVGPALAGGARAAGAAPSVVQALNTAGMTTGRAPVGMAAKAGDLALRSGAAGAVGVGAAGAVNPEDALMGGAIGAATPGAVKAAGELGRGVGAMMRPDADRVALAQKAMAEGIPVSLGDVSGNAMVKGARSFLDDVPLIGRIGNKSSDRVQEGFNRAISKRIGEDAPKVTEALMDKAKGRIGGELDRIWSSNPLQIDGKLVADLSKIRSDAATKLNPEQAAQVERQIQTLLGKATGTDIDGAFANNWQSELRMIADSEKGLHKKLLSDLRGSVISAFNRSVSPQDAAALKQAREQYKAFKTIQPLAQKSAAGTAGRAEGDIPAALLPEAVRQSYGDVGRSPFADLTQIGSQFVADRVSRTGGSARAMLQNSALGTSLALGSWHSPLAPLIGVPLATGLEAALSSPTLARGLLSSGSAQLPPGLLQSGYRVAPLLATDQ